MRRVLVVWEANPEYTDLFSLELSGEELEMVLRCHGRFVNTDSENGYEADLEWLSKRLASEKAIQRIGIFGRPILLEHFDILVVTGFVM
jgi:hypothetical protein